MSHQHPDPPAGADYLWDRQGPIDAQVAALERALAPLAWREAPRQQAGASAAPARAPQPLRARRRRWGRVAAGLAASLFLLVGMGEAYRYRLQWPQDQAWRVDRMAGPASGAGDRLAPGQWLETGAQGRVHLRAARIGEVIVGEHSRFRIVQTRSGRHRTQLEHGVLWARVWAPPGQFGVDTSMGQAIDLGCEFVLRAESDGSGSLSVRSGWVQLDNGWREVLVPEGARVDVAAGGKFGTPYDLRSSTAFRGVLRKLDALPTHAAANPVLVRALLDSAGPHDTLSLIALMKSRPGLREGPVFDHINATMPAQARITREQVQREGDAAYNAWWQALPYPRVKRWWAQWPDVLPSQASAEDVLREDAYR